MRLLIIAIFLATTAFGFFLKYLNYSMRNATLPENVRDVYDEDAYKKNQAYKMEGLKFSIVSGLVGTAVMLAFLLLNFHHTLYVFVSTHTSSIYLTGMFILFVPIFVGNVIDMVLDIYDTFVIEEKYGFNKTTTKTFVLDFVKSLLLVVLLLGGILSLFLFLHERLGNMVFAAFFFVLLAIRLIFTFLAPFFIRIFNKLTPLDEGELKQKIEALATKHGYKLKGIFKVDASKRSTKINAFATGFGKTKTIGLYDTLLEKMTDDEIVGVLAHEIGHAKFRHILKSTPLSLLSFVIMLAAAYFIVTMPEVSMAFGFSDANVVFGLYVLFIMLSPISLVLGIPASALSRKFEFEADAFEKEQVGKEVAISAMKKLCRENLANLTPHPFVVMMEYSHPTASQRIAAFERD